MADLERTYNVPLRKGFMKAPRYMRGNKATRVLRTFLERHMKSKDVRIGPFLNSKILEHGRKNIPHHVEVKTIKDKDGVVRAEYAKAKNLDFLKPKKEEKKEDEMKLKIPGFGKKKQPFGKALAEKEEKLEKKVDKKEEKEIIGRKSRKTIKQIFFIKKLTIYPLLNNLFFIFNSNSSKTYVTQTL